MNEQFSDITKNSGLVYHLSLTLKIYSRGFLLLYITKYYTKIRYFLLKRLTYPNVRESLSTSIFHLIYFQTIFSVFSSSSDASTCFQIETPSFYPVNGFALGTGAQNDLGLPEPCEQVVVRCSF